MPKGFMRVANQIISEHPEGLTMGEVAEEALHRDPSLSNARDPVFSLGTTLAKQVRMGWEPAIETRDTRRPIRYFPKRRSDRENGSVPPPQRSATSDDRAPGKGLLTLVAGDAQLRASLEPRNIDLAISILQQVRKHLDTG